MELRMILFLASSIPGHLRHGQSKVKITHSTLFKFDVEAYQLSLTPDLPLIYEGT
jgi:hypothetical protein